MSGYDELIARLKKFEGRADLHPAPYQIQDAQGNPDGWVPMVRVFQHSSSNIVVTPLWPKENNPSKTRAEAELRSVVMGLEWLERKG